MILTENKKIKLFAGAAKVKAAYMGAVKVYPNASLEVSPSLVFAAAGGAADLSILVEEGQAWSIAGLPAGWSASATSGTGPASVSISAPNNTSTGAMNGLLTVSSDDLSATCSLAQAAGKIVYGNWQNVSLLIDTTAFPASGGSSRVVMEVRRDWTWNGVAGSGSYEMSTASLYSPLSSDGVATFNGNNVLVASLGVAFKAAATITISAVTEHDSTRKSASITQAANYVTEGYNLITRPTTFPVAPAGGGTIQVVWDSYPTQESINALWGFKWASGARGSYTQALAGGTLAGYAHYSWTGASGNFTYLNSATGDVSVASKGTAVSGVTGGPTVYPGQTLTFTNHAAYGGTVVTWEDVTTPCSLQQAANHIVAIQLTPGSLSYASVSYAGGSSSPKTTYQDGWHFKFSSGATTTSNTVPAGYGTETIHNTWTGSAAGASIGTTWGEVVWSQNNSATSRSITVTRTVYNVLTPNAANYPGAPTVMSNTQTYVGICTQSGIPQSSELRYQYADQPSQYPRFIRNGPPSGSIERSYRSAIRSTRGSTVTYHDGTISNVAAYDLADYISTTNYSIGFNPYTGSEFINNYPYTYGTVSFTVTGGNPSRSFSCIALFEKNYRDYEAAGYPSWLLPIDPDNKEFGLLEPLALSSTECSVLRTLATEGVAVLSGDEAAEVDLVALSARINAARRPDTNRYVRQEDGTWTVIEEARRK